MGAGPRRMRKVVTLQTAINLQETRVRTPLLPPVCVKQAEPWWGQELYGTQGHENVPECTEDSATLRGQSSLCHQIFTFSGKGS